MPRTILFLNSFSFLSSFLSSFLGSRFLCILGLIWPLQLSAESTSESSRDAWSIAARTGPAISVGGSGTYVPFLGNAMMGLEGIEVPSENYPGLYYDGVVRIYPNTKARGLYGGAGFHVLQGDLSGRLIRQGYTGRLGLYTERKAIFTRLEMGIGYYGLVELGDFNADKDGVFPLIQPTFGFTVGAAVF